MRTLQALAAALVMVISGCDQGLQGDVRDLGEAIQHCREYSKKVLISDVVISVDQLSTREQGGYYKVFLNLDNQHKHGYASCEVDMSGLIVNYSAPGFHKNTGAFSQFSNN
ncbi:MAG: hypothetical protein CMI02_08885 [Oceanospirillaceae bacterium]|nr:hypothetical protein [Oceanospirillaceae bacterium]MBT12136.1 hypothetical protein [Oceanospirillaceae bacterium]|tara:strand:+ start:20321 stop:20653 length:333 start_codon:yes stop_codon:yes gene_type:complete